MAASWFGVPGAAGGVGALFAARIVQGLSTGAALGAVGAGLLDLDRARGSTVNAAGPTLGTAIGALASGLSVAFLPAPQHLIYLLLMVVFALQALALAATAETVSPRPGALASLRPAFHAKNETESLRMVRGMARAATAAMSASAIGALNTACMRLTIVSQ